MPSLAAISTTCEDVIHSVVLSQVPIQYLEDNFIREICSYSAQVVDWKDLVDYVISAHH